jgi:hypothetical protein
MATSQCVGCGRTFTIPGPDRAPYCFPCAERQDLTPPAAPAASRGSWWPWVFGLCLLAVMLMVFSAKADSDPEPSADRFAPPFAPVRPAPR